MEITTINVVYYSFELLKEPTHPWLLIYLSTEEEMTSDSTESNELEMRRIKRPLSPLKECVSVANNKLNLLPVKFNMKSQRTEK